MADMDGPSRTKRRANTKSYIIRKCQTATRGAANRARKTLNGQSRTPAYVVTNDYIVSVMKSHLSVMESFIN